MNLYLVCVKDAEWVAFVFAERAGLAKSAFKKEFDYYADWGIDYVDIRAYLRGKTDKVTETTVVDDPQHPQYPIVLELGCRYASLEELEEMEREC